MKSTVFIGSGFPIIAFAVIAVVVGIMLAFSIKRVPEHTLYIRRRPHEGDKALTPGYHFLIPFSDSIVGTLSTEKQQLSCKPLYALTRDEVTAEITMHLTYRITEQFNCEIDQPVLALEKLAASAVTTIINNQTLEEAHSSRRETEAKLADILNQAAARWKVTVSDAEITAIRST